MRRASLILSSLLLLASPASGAGIRVHVDHDPDTVFAEYTTFQLKGTWRDLRQASPPLHEWVALQIIGYARQAGLALVEREPDLNVAYYAAYPGDLQLVREELGYAYGERFSPGTYWRRRGTAGDAAKGSLTFERGALIVDVWDPRRGVVVWRGIATGAVRGKLEIDKQRLARALERLMKRWDEMYGDSAEAMRRLEATSKP